MPARDYSLLQRYWFHEPWGAWRENIHAAIIAAEIRRPNLKKGAKVQLDDFMLRHPEEVEMERARKQGEANRKLFETLKAMAKRKPRG